MDDINKIASAEGWALVTMFENGSTKPLWDIKGLTMKDVDARSFVVSKAKALSRLHQQALQAVLMSRAAPPPKRKAR